MTFETMNNSYNLIKAEKAKCITAKNQKLNHRGKRPMCKPLDIYF